MGAGGIRHHRTNRLKKIPMPHTPHRGFWWRVFDCPGPGPGSTGGHDLLITSFSNKLSKFSPFTFSTWRHYFPSLSFCALIT